MKKLFIITVLMALAMNGFAQIFHYDFSAVCETGQTLYYRILSNDALEVTVAPPQYAGWGNYPKPEGDLVVPETVEHEGNTYTVVSLYENAFDSCDELVSVMLPSSIRRIEAEAFYACDGLSCDIVIPEHCTFIGGYAFDGCSSLTSITIGAAIDTVEYAAFRDCTGLQYIQCNTLNPPYRVKITSMYFDDIKMFENVPNDIPVYVNCLTMEQFQLDYDWCQFTNLQGIFVSVPELTVSANDPNLGTVEIVSIPDDCDIMTATVRATPNADHVFGCWKKNDIVASYDPEYTFRLNEACLLTAYFDVTYIMNDTIGYPVHVIGRKNNASGQVTDTYTSDFLYSEAGQLSRFERDWNPNETSYDFYKYPSLLSNICTVHHEHPYYEENHTVQYNDYDQVTRILYGCTSPMIEGYVYDFSYDDSHRLIQKRYEDVNETWMLYSYEYEDGNRTQIESCYEGSETENHLSARTTNHYDEWLNLLTSQVDTYDEWGQITSSTLKTYSYTNHHKLEREVTQIKNDDEWVNSEIVNYLYDGIDRVVEYQTGIWSIETNDWDITNKTIYDYDDLDKKLTISFHRKTNGEWGRDYYRNQPLLYDAELNAWQSTLQQTYQNMGINQFEMSLRYDLIEVTFPPLSEWYYEIEWENGDITYQHLEYAADTTMGDKRPKVIVRSNTHYDRNGYTEMTHEYIYEENGKVYWWNKDLQEFTVLYDYAAEQGDEWEIKVGSESIIVHVDNVGVFNHEGTVRKMLHISDADNIFTGDIVVGYGHMTSFFPEKLMHTRSNFTVGGLRCYWVGAALRLHQGDDDCDAIYTGLHDGINEPEDVAAFAVYPNPANNVLFVETSPYETVTQFETFQETSLHTYLITNLMGQTLLQGSITTENQQINIEKLPAGMYFISINGETVKFVVK